MVTSEVKLINQGQEDEMEVWAYRPCVWKRVLVGFGAAASGGLLLLLLYWLPEWRVKATCNASPLRDARTLLLRATDEFRQWFRVTVHVMLAPGKRPFDAVPPCAGDGLSNGEGAPSLSTEHGDCCGKFPHNQLVPVPAQHG